MNGHSETSFRPLHRLGQNFLIDRNVLAEIVSRSKAGAEDSILEVGPGKGVLTRALLEAGVGCLHAVELDQRLRPELERIAEGNPRLILHWADALKVDYTAFSPFPNKAVANIPYKITTPLIWKLLGLAPLGLTYHLYMVQKEAADRLAAPADTRARYPLGVTLEVMGSVARVRRVPPSCFRPAPKVESALIELVLQRNLDLAQDPLWSQLLHRAFAHRRKTLANNLGRDWIEFLEAAGISPRVRAEDLEGGAWLELYRLSKSAGWVTR